MLKTRILAAVPIILVVYFALRHDACSGNTWGLTAAMLVVTVMALREFYRMARARGAEPFSLFGCVIGALLVLVHERWCWEKWHGLERAFPDLMSTLVAVAVLGTFLLQGLRPDMRGAMFNISTTMLGWIYVWFLPSFLPRMRHLSLRHGWEYDGIEFVFICIFIAKLSDVGGLLVGSHLGRHKLCPNLSPKKTWEGLAGGMIFSMGSIAAIAGFCPASAIASLGWGRILVLGALLAVAALLGDLIESCFKRDSQVKDAGTSVPGFGGVLDLVDSLMVGAPAMYFFLILAGAHAG